MSTYKKQFRHMSNTFGTHFYDTALNSEAAGNLERWQWSIDIIEDIDEIRVLYLIEWLIRGDNPPGQ